MISSNSLSSYQSNSPLGSTEEKSLQDNIDINKINLEKGLKNRPNQNVLVDRGILLNPGKAYSDKMHQLDFSKKRDSLKKKMENRPDREELVRKLILTEGNENRKDAFNKIKDLLDNSINTRPGSLELVDKNILKVDHLLASKVHNGDIRYPKVGLLDINLPSIAEVESTTQPPNKSITKPGPQLSCKKTCRVGRYSFHNIEFQKAREYQQKELLEYENIQAQHDPSLRRVHSELAMKSRKINESRPEKYRSSKHSLLHRLNVHELKSECKVRMIACSNVPKAQLVEKLLPYEAEVLSTHTSFDSNRNLQMYTPDRKSTSSIKSSSDFSPPDYVSKPNLSPPSYSSMLEQQQQLNMKQLNTITHSISAPIIQDFINQSNSLPHSQFKVNNSSAMNIYNLHNFNPNNSFPSLNGNFFNPHLSFNSCLSKEFPQETIKPENVMFQSQPHTLLNNNCCSGFDRANEMPVIEYTQQTMPVPGNYYNSGHSFDKSPQFINTINTVSGNNWSNQASVDIPSEAHFPLVPIDCIHKFETISKCIAAYKNKVDEINRLKKSNIIPMPSLIEQSKSICSYLISQTYEMINSIKGEQKTNKIDNNIATKQLNWLNNLIELIDSNCNLYSISEQFNGTELFSPNGNVSINNGDFEMESLDNCGDYLLDLYNEESDLISDLSMDNNVFLKSERPESTVNSRSIYMDHDLKTPETPFSDLCNSPMSTELFSNCLINF